MASPSPCPSSTTSPYNRNAHFSQDITTFLTFTESVLLLLIDCHGLDALGQCSHHIPLLHRSQFWRQRSLRHQIGCRAIFGILHRTQGALSHSCLSRMTPRKHILTYTGVKPHKCDQCEFCSITSSDLKRHKKTHSGEKPHRCNFCEFATSTNNQLKQHKRHVHSGEKPYKCNQCNYSSACAGNLRRHMLTHGGKNQICTTSQNV